MAVRHGYGKIAGTDALVFAYDTGDTRNSYRGEPTANVVNTNGQGFNPLDLYTWASSGNTSTWSRDTTAERSPAGGIPLKEVSSGTDSYSSTYGAGPQWNLGAASAGQTWTVSVYAKAAAGTNLQLWLFEAAGSGGYLEITMNNFNATGDWQRISVTRTLTNGSTAAVQARVATATNGGIIWWDGLQMEQKAHATQFTGATRSATQGLLDVAGGKSIDLGYVSFDSNADIEFDGTNDVITCTSGFPSSVSEYTIEYVARLDSAGKMPIASYTNNAFYKYGDYSWAYTHGGTWDEFYYPGGSITGWGHWVITYDGSNVKVYRNNSYLGAKASSGTANLSQGWRIGYWASEGNYAWAGKIPVVKIYTRALTQAEATNNYHFYKNRFSLP